MNESIGVGLSSELLGVIRSNSGHQRQMDSEHRKIRGTGLHAVNAGVERRALQRDFLGRRSTRWNQQWQCDRISMQFRRRQAYETVRKPDRFSLHWKA